MAQIKIKRTSTSTVPTGLTFGELAYVQGIKSIYIGQTAGDPALRIGAEVDTSTSLGTSDNKIPTQNAVKTYVDNNVASGAVASLNGLTGAVFIGAGTGISLAVAGKGITLTNTGVQSIAGTTNQITASGSTGAVTLSLPSALTVPGSLSVTTNLTVTGNLTVNGTTTTVNSDSMTIDDPLLTLGTSGGVPIAASDGGKDRGIAFNYYDTAGRTGFFGWDASGSKFIFAGNATVASDVVTVSNFSPIQASSIQLYSATEGFNSEIIPTTLNGTRTYTLPDVSGTIITTGDTGTVTSTMIADGTIFNGDIHASAGIVDTKLATIATADKVSLTALNIDGGTDIGAALADVDLIIVDDGGAGTNRKAAVTRISDYVFGKVSGDITIASNGAATIAANSVALGTDTTGNYVATISSSSTGLNVQNSGTESAAVTIDFATITTGLNMGTFSFASGEFTNSSGTISLGVVDGGSY